MSLADHWDNGTYLGAGEHRVRVKSVRVFDCNSGNKGVEFKLADRAGRETKASFILTDKALWRLANFAKACGLTMEQCKKYDPHNESSHKMLLNKELVVVVEKVGKYHEATDYLPASAGVKEAEPKKATADKATERVIEETVPPSDDEIPF